MSNAYEEDIERSDSNELSGYYKEVFLENLNMLSKAELKHLKKKVLVHLELIGKRERLVDSLDPWMGFMSTETNQPLRRSGLIEQLAKWGIDYAVFAKDAFSEDTAIRDNILADAHVAFCTIQKNSLQGV